MPYSTARGITVSEPRLEGSVDSVEEVLILGASNVRLPICRLPLHAVLPFPSRDWKGALTVSKKSTYWGPAMSDSQYAVFHFDVKTMTMAETTPMIFDSLSDAQRHCQERIATTPAQGCRIYGHDGKIVQTFSDDKLYEQHHGRPAAKRNVIIGSLCLLAGISGVALDAWLEWRLTLGVLLGARFLWVGTVKMADGIAGMMDKR